MNVFRTVLTVLSYASVAGAPLLALTGFGVPGAIVLGGVSGLAGVWLHFLDSPRKAPDVAAAVGQTAQVVQSTAQQVKKPTP